MSLVCSKEISFVRRSHSFSIINSAFSNSFVLMYFLCIWEECQVIPSCYPVCHKTPEVADKLSIKLAKSNSIKIKTLITANLKGSPYLLSKQNYRIMSEIFQEVVEKGGT